MARWLGDLDEVAWDRTLAINLKSTFLVTKAVATSMRECRRGRIVMVASIAGRNMSRLSGPDYSAAKGGMLAFMRHMAVELGPFGVTVNAVAGPRPHDGGTGGKEMGVERERGTGAGPAKHPPGTTGTTRGVAAAILFLASEDASYITGACLDVNGGAFMM